MRRLAPLLALVLAGCSSPWAAGNTLPSSAEPAPSASVAAASPAASTAPVVVTLGDSVPAGTACGCDPFPDLYARMLSPDAQSENLAQPGYTSTDVLGQIDDDGIRAQIRGATVVLIMAGANDMADAFDNGADETTYQETADQVVANVQATVATIKQVHVAPVTILVLGYWNVVKDGAVGLAEYGADGLASADTATRYCNKALRQAAASTGAQFVTTSAAFKGEHRDQDPTGLLASDGDHPNAQGHQAIADAIYAAVPTG